ncbi:MAG TPA: alpha/beta fold hydrolase [Vicinamibacterales bacterium]
MSRQIPVVLICLLDLIATAGGCARRPPLTAIIAGGSGPPTLVLLHGYGSSAERWAPFTQTIRWPAPGRFVFPQGPDLMVRTDGAPDGRAWWPLDLTSYIPAGEAVPNMSGARPPGLKAAASLVEALLHDRGSVPRGPVVLGGYSQGAMVASEVAFGSRVPLSALVILSGALVDERSWESQFNERRGLPVFLAHGRRDRTLPFDAADRFRQKLEAAGLQVTWCPFDGGHDIPAAVVIALNDFLDRLHLGGTARR